jgi:hypothetical protein
MNAKPAYRDHAFRIFKNYSVIPGKNEHDIIELKVWGSVACGYS